MRLIDGDSLCRSLVDWMFESFGKDDGHDVEFELINKVVAGIDAHPTIDTVPVVRCKDCKHWVKRTKCYDRRFCGVVDMFTNPNWFCANGEREDGDGDG